MKRTRFILSALVFLLGLSACGPKEMDLSGLMATSGGAVLEDTILLEVEIPRRFEVALPMEGATFRVESSGEGLAVSAIEGGFELVGTTPGDYALTLHIEAEKYEPAVYELPPVRVVPHPMSLELFGTEIGGYVPPEGVVIARGGKMTITAELSVEDADDIAFTIADESVATLERTGSQVIITGAYPGETVLTVTATKALHETATQTLPITVEPTPAALALAQSATGIIVGETGSVGISYQQGGTLTLEYDKTGVDVIHNAGTLTISGLKAGQYAVQISCSADGYKTATAALGVTVSQPSVQIAVANTLSLRTGESRQVALRVTPSDAEITVATTGSLEASYAGGSVTISSSAKGTGTVTVTAAKEGYQSATASISVTAETALPDVDTSTYASLVQQIIVYTNVERERLGLSTLTHMADLDKLATVRAQEAVRLWSHTRPDGRDCLTIFDDYGISYWGAGENLFSGNVNDARRVVDDFMASPIHKETLTRPEWTGIGIGVFYSGGEYYIAQLFIQPK